MIKKPMICFITDFLVVFHSSLAGSMMAGIRYSVPPGVGQYSSWQPPYTILPGQLTQMMPGVEGSPYNVSQLAAQMSQLGVNSVSLAPRYLFIFFAQYTIHRLNDLIFLFNKIWKSRFFPTFS